MKNLSDIPRNVIYSLKRRFGKAAGFYSYQSTTTDYDTGVSTKDYNIYEISKVVILNERIKRDFIAANKNFTYGGLFDTGVRFAIIDAKDLSVDIKDNDHFLIDDKRYEVQNPEKYNNAWLFELKHIDSDTPYDSDLNTFISDGWSSSIKAKIAADEFMRTLRDDVYNAAAIPSNSLIWLCAGDNLTEALKCVIHPSGIGTSLTNSGFESTNYIERGDDAGLDGDGTNYLNLDYNLNSQISFDNLHIAISGYDLENIGSLFGATGFKITDGDLDSEVALDPGTLSNNTIIISSTAADSIKIFVDGTEQDSDTSTRSNALPNLDAYLYAHNGGPNIGDYRITFLSIGNGLSDAKVSILNSAINTYNTRLGR